MAGEPVWHRLRVGDMHHGNAKLPGRFDIFRVVVKENGLIRAKALFFQYPLKIRASGLRMPIS